MYDEILFPTDGSDPAERALAYAVDVADEHDARLHVLHVADTGRDSVTTVRGDVVDVLAGAGEEIVAAAESRASDRGIDAVTEVLQGDPHRTIVEYAGEFDIDLVVMATHGRRGLRRFLLGSVTERVINTSTVPVIAINPDGERDPAYPGGDVLVPTDGSAGAERAVTAGAANAAATGATLHLLHVVETGSLGPDARSALHEGGLADRAAEVVASATELARAASVDDPATAIVNGEPSREIRTYVDEQGIDLAILGTHGRTDFSRYVMGGVSARLVRTSPVPVMWVREPESGDGQS